MIDRHARHRRAFTDRRRRPVDGFRVTSPDRFERLVIDAVAGLPSRLSAHLDGVRIAIEDVPPAAPQGPDEQVPLSRYEVAPSATREGDDARRPDRLVLYRRPLEARAFSHRDLADLVRQALSMQIARQVGIDDDLGEPGWD